jgi:ribose/xylose/arabinose/galactoside ABC-type transport system permease subunit
VKVVVVVKEDGYDLSVCAAVAAATVCAGIWINMGIVPPPPAALVAPPLSEQLGSR